MSPILGGPPTPMGQQTPMGGYMRYVSPPSHLGTSRR
jgi:hypothetical protein